MTQLALALRWPLLGRHPWRRLIAWLLHLANARPPFRREEFYALKDRLLCRYGTMFGFDVQRITDPCWGYEADGGCCGPHCRKCWGTGIWRDRWILLERWQCHGYLFHRPRRMTSESEARSATIHGRIEHRDVDAQASAEAALWLFLIYDRGTWWRETRGHCFTVWSWHPLLCVQRIVMPLHLWLSRWRPRPCGRCGRRFIRPFESGYWFACRRCSPPVRQLLARHEERVREEIPF